MSKTRKIIRNVLLIFMIVFAILLLGSTYTIEKQVQRVCRTAAELYPGDPVEAVISLARRDDTCTREKAKALWALGQLGDPKALPYLRSSFGESPEDNLCTYEANFAIKKLEEKRFNLPGFLWRKLLSK
ncbi:HEAT repeat domain-containing protein [bacterium]|nr:HEAT repeat domain-containing protein [bacterium]